MAGNHFDITVGKGLTLKACYVLNIGKTLITFHRAVLS